MQGNDLIPISISANRLEKQMTIVWDDGHTSVYTFSILRAGCPCVECRGGHEHMSDRPDPGAFTANLPDSPATRLVNIVPVGAYAISMVWEDGHDAGIFRWEFLRALCPCAECRQGST
jgi:DUF971 family protein